MNEPLYPTIAADCCRPVDKDKDHRRYRKCFIITIVVAVESQFMTPKRPSSASGRASRGASHSSSRSGQLRIIGGEYRRRLLPVLDSPGLRPTPDRVRETLFNWLTGALYTGRVLDLFAGTGALGIEALSRGAREATFIESDRQVARLIEQNLATLGITAGKVIQADAIAWLQHTTPSAPYALVMLDPPFRLGLAAPCCAALAGSGWLAPGSWIYLEVEAGLEIEVPGDWQLHRELRAGDSHARLYRHRQD